MKMIIKKDFISSMIGFMVMIICWVGALLIVALILDSIFAIWGNGYEREHRQKINDFCESFLKKDSVLYGRCVDAFGDFDF